MNPPEICALLDAILDLIWLPAAVFIATALIFAGATLFSHWGE